MTPLAIDFGTKNIGLAYAVNGIIFTLAPIKNNSTKFTIINKIISDYSIDYIYVGISEGKVALLTRKFVDSLRGKTALEVETVEEAVSTIEAEGILKNNRKFNQKYKQSIDSTSAAVILRRVIS